MTLTLPDLTYVGEQFETMNVDAICQVHKWLTKTLAQQFESLFLTQYKALVNDEKPYIYHSDDIAERKLKNICLYYLSKIDSHISLVESQYHNATNMTDVLAALSALSHTDSQARTTCLEDFYSKWKEDTLVLDKWFAIQAGANHPQALEQVKALVEHQDFIITNPNRVRSVLGVFGRLNLLGFHQAAGQGYEFLANQILKLDQINPQVAARMVSPFTHWQKMDNQRQEKMKASLKQILSSDKLSKDVYEIVSKSLG